MTHILSHTLFSRGIIIFQGVLTKFNFSMKFPHLEKFANLMMGDGVWGFSWGGGGVVVVVVGWVGWMLVRWLGGGGGWVMCW